MNRPDSAAPVVNDKQGHVALLNQPELRPAGRAHLFLAWSSGREFTNDSCISPLSDCSFRRDRGLWLFRGAQTRHLQWQRLAASTDGLEDVRIAPLYPFAKRAIDLLAASLMLGFAAPILLLVPLFIRLDTPGPVFFRQRRIGLHGQAFTLWKFRTMHTGSAVYAHSPTREDDPRITGIGRFLRRASIDELPQLINVLRGEMSLVGPRPEMPFLAADYSARERRRLAVKPGITGLWQISPARAQPIHENVAYDLHYIRHRSLVLDAAILLRTVAAVIHGVGAI